MQTAIKSRNLFKQRIVSDYSFAKSSIFAKVNLPPDEFTLFHTMYQMMAAQLPRPEVVAILDPGRERQKLKSSSEDASMSKIFQTTTSIEWPKPTLLLPSPSRISGHLG